MTPILYAKLGGAMVLIVGLFMAGYHLGGLASKTKLEALQAANATALAKAYQDRETAAQAKEAAYEKEINGLKTDALTTYPTVAVRMCPSSPAVPATGKGGQVLPTNAGVGQSHPIEVPQSQGPDYGPSLFGLADALDQIAAKCR